LVAAKRRSRGTEIPLVQQPIQAKPGVAVATLPAKQSRSRRGPDLRGARICACADSEKAGRGRGQAVVGSLRRCEAGKGEMKTRSEASIRRRRREKREFSRGAVGRSANFLVHPLNYQNG
jgi:hypothetical protein